MNGGAVLALDQGTTGSTALVVSADGRILARAYSEFAQHFPRPGWVEHDADEIWRTTRRVAREALAGARAEVAAIGIANQRETVVLWDPETLTPLRRAVVWQDRRSEAICRELKRAGHEKMVRRRTGLVLDPYFPGTKLRWLIERDRELAGRAERGELAVGTIDSWLVAKLTAGAVHATDHTNASRTLLYDLESGEWSPELLSLMGVPTRALPEVRPSRGDFGVAVGDALGVELPIGAVVGDQQAALYGQGCWEGGAGKCTYGTGAFLLLHTGRRRTFSKHGLLATVACDANGGRAYALEGSIFAAGAAIQWLRDGLGVLEHAADSETLARSLEVNDGVYMVPAFTGLGAPHWRPDARASIVGLTRGTTRAHLARAALEAMAYGTRELLGAMQMDAGRAPKALRVDGGAALNDWLMGFLAGILDLPVVRPAVVETTALGAAGLAGLSAGVWSAPADFAAAFGAGRRFEPTMGTEERAGLVAGWERAVKSVLT